MPKYELVLLKNMSQPGYTGSLADYEQAGGYQALRNSLGKIPPAEVTAKVMKSGLRGRGGAGFPTGVKWEAVRKTPADAKYVVCNADESEPGTFKDRVLLLDDPHRTIEGLLICGYAIGASRGYIYLRGEYEYLQPVIESALE